MRRTTLPRIFLPKSLLKKKTFDFIPESLNSVIKTKIKVVKHTYKNSLMLTLIQYLFVMLYFVVCTLCQYLNIVAEFLLIFS